MLGVERFSFLPDLQGNGGDLACQRQTRHLRPYSFLQQPKVKLAKYSLANGGRVGCALEHVLQFVVVIPVQVANQCRSFSALHLSVNHAVFGAVASLHREPRSRSRTGASCGIGAASAPARSAPLHAAALETAPSAAT